MIHLDQILQGVLSSGADGDQEPAKRRRLLSVNDDGVFPNFAGLDLSNVAAFSCFILVENVSELGLEFLISDGSGGNYKSVIVFEAVD